MINILVLKFDGKEPDRRSFLSQIRKSVMSFTGETMTLDALVNEIAKNIFDHAQGKGSLLIRLKNGQFEFVIKDDGQDSYEFEKYRGKSKLAGNGTNFGIGLDMILDLAKGLNIELKIDTTKGFTYSGVYKPLFIE